MLDQDDKKFINEMVIGVADELGFIIKDCFTSYRMMHEGLIEKLIDIDNTLDQISETLNLIET